MMDSRCEMVRPYPSLEECGKPTTQGWRGAMGIIPSCQDCAARTGVSLYMRPLDALKRDQQTVDACRAVASSFNLSMSSDAQLAARMLQHTAMVCGMVTDAMGIKT